MTDTRKFEKNGKNETHKRSNIKANCTMTCNKHAHL